MDYKLVILKQAAQEIENIFDYYAQFSTSSVLKFDSQLEHIFQVLETNPFFQIKYKNIRAVPFKLLPYLVIFEINEQEKIVYIYSVFHTAQHPNKYPEK